jgi:hypothetical protein
MFYTSTGFAISGEMITDILGYTGDMFTDLAPLLLLLFGVGLATIFITAVIKAIRGD